METLARTSQKPRKISLLRRSRPRLLKTVVLLLVACFTTVLLALSVTTSINAYADYTVPISTNWSPNRFFWRTDELTVPNDALSLVFTALDTSPHAWRYARFGTGANAPGNTTLSIVDNRVDLSAYAGQSGYLFCYYGTNPNNFEYTTINDVSIAWEYAGNPPDNNNYATEQRYYSVNWGSSQFTKSNSLPLIYSVEHTLDEFTPDGQCNSIQVDASTVGGDALEWRLNLGQSGIDGQTAWLPIGYKMPVEVGSFDLHSVQLRMKDPADPTQYYPLDPSELSLCTVTYGYTSDVVLQLPHGDYQQVPTGSGYEEIQPPTVPSLDDLAGDYQDGWIADYLSVPIASVVRVFAPMLIRPDLFVLLVVCVFTAIVFAIIW